MPARQSMLPLSQIALSGEIRISLRIDTTLYDGTHAGVSLKRCCFS